MRAPTSPGHGNSDARTLNPETPIRTLNPGPSTPHAGPDDHEDPDELLDLPSLSFLGPPSAAYPGDPDKFVYVRVAGGYSPQFVSEAKGCGVEGVERV